MGSNGAAEARKKGKYYKEELPNGIKKGNIETINQAYNWKAIVILLAMLLALLSFMLAIKGKKVEDYKEFVMGEWDGSEIFKMNLYPIAFDSTDENLWHQYGLNKITGFDRKTHFPNLVLCE